MNDLKPEQKPAGFWIRCLARFLDNLIVIAFVSLLGSVLAKDNPMAPVYFLVTPIVAAWLYYSLFESSSCQASPGKLATGLIVVDRFGKRITFGQATAKYFSLLVSMVFLPPILLMVAFRKDKRGLHNILSKTFVLKLDESARWASIQDVPYVDQIHPNYEKI